MSSKHLITMPGWRRWLGPRTQLWAGVALGLAALYLAARGLDFAQLGRVLREVRLPYVFLTLGLYLLTQVAKGIRWRWLMSPRRPALSLGRASSLLVVGQALNLLLPSRLGDLVRAYAAGEEAGISKLYVLGTVAAEKLLDLVTLALLVLALLPLMTLPGWLAGRVGPVLVTAVAVAAGVAVLLAGRRVWLRVAGRLLASLPPAPARRWQERLAAGMDGLTALVQPGALVAIWWWTLVAWVLAALTNLALFLAFSLPAAALPALFLLAVLQAGVAVPSSPGKIGVFHALCVLALSAFGIAGSVALGYGVTLHVIVVGSSSAWGALALWQRSWSLRRTWVLDT